VHREQLRISMDEPYRTLLGHFRHEIGHYYFFRLVGPSGEYVKEFTELFGDPDEDYQDALDRHYSQGPPEGWERDFVSSYATMHPAEDWAETFAHYLHIRDTLDTSAAFSFAPAGATYERRTLGPSGFDTLIEMWLPLAWALNMVNRSMGKGDLYPFVLTPRSWRKCASFIPSSTRSRRNQSHWPQSAPEPPPPEPPPPRRETATGDGVTRETCSGIQFRGEISGGCRPPWC